MSIIISKKGKNARKIDQTHFKDENYLQAYIHENPEVIPLHELDEDIKLLVLSREFQTKSGPIDAIGIDRFGELYIIETKLYKNPDKRLVVAQVLDYGASLWKHSIDVSEFISYLNDEVLKRHGTTLHERLVKSFEIDETDLEEILTNLENNLNAGNFKFVVLMDKLHDRLKDLIIFMNQNSNFDIFAVELEYYKLEEMEIIIPKLYGSQVKKSMSRKTTAGSRRSWRKGEILEEAENQLSDMEFAAFKKLFEFCETHADRVKLGTGIKRGSFSPVFSTFSNRSIHTVYTDGKLVSNFGWLDDSQDAIRLREKLRDELGNASFSFPDEATFPKTEIHEWAPKVEALIDAIKKALNL